MEVAGISVGPFRFLGSVSSSNIKTCGFGLTNGVEDETWSSSGMFLNITSSNESVGWQIRSNLDGSLLRFRTLQNGNWGAWEKISFI